MVSPMPIRTLSILWRRAFRALALLRRHDPTVPRIGRRQVRLRVVEGGGAYGESTAASRAAVSAARPLVLEETYTGKTLAVLLRERPERALFLNTFARARRASPSPPA